MCRPLRLCFFSDTNFWKENNFSDQLKNYFYQLLFQSLKPHSWPHNGRCDKFLSLGTKQKHIDISCDAECVLVQRPLHTFLSCKQIFYFCYQKLNVAVNNVTHTLLTCNDLPLNSFSCCLKGLSWKIFLPWPRSLHACCLMVFRYFLEMLFCATFHFIFSQTCSPFHSETLCIFNYFKLNSCNTWDKDSFPYFVIVSQENW